VQINLEISLESLPIKFQKFSYYLGVSIVATYHKDNYIVQ